MYKHGERHHQKLARGSPLYSKWRNMVREGREGTWTTYLNFKNDVIDEFDPDDSNLILVRKDKSKPWSKDNYRWDTRKKSSK